MSDNEKTPFESTYPELDLPEFKSKIPEYLLVDVSQQDRFLLEQMSVNTQMTEFILHALIQTHGYVRNTNGRTNKNEDAIKFLREDVNRVSNQMKKISPIIERFINIWGLLKQKPVWMILLFFGVSSIFFLYFLLSHYAVLPMIQNIFKVFGS